MQMYSSSPSWELANSRGYNPRINSRKECWPGEQGRLRGPSHSEALQEPPLQRWRSSQDQNERGSESISVEGNRARTFLTNFKDKREMLRCFHLGVALGALVLLTFRDTHLPFLTIKWYKKNVLFNH